MEVPAAISVSSRVKPRISQDCASVTIGRQLHKPHSFGLDDPIMFRQPLVQEGVIAVNKLQQTSVPLRTCSKAISVSPRMACRSSRFNQKLISVTNLCLDFAGSIFSLIYRPRYGCFFSYSFKRDFNGVCSCLVASARAFFCHWTASENCSHS